MKLICKFCKEPVQWVTVHVGHGPDFRYKIMPISAEPDAKGLVILYQEEFQLKRRNEIKKTPENKRFLSHGYVPCVAQRHDRLEEEAKPRMHEAKVAIRTRGDCGGTKDLITNLAGLDRSGETESGS